MLAIWSYLFPELRRLPPGLRAEALRRAMPPVGRPPSRARRWWRWINLVLWPPVLAAPWAGWSASRWGVVIMVIAGLWLAWPRISRVAALIRERRVVKLRLRRVLADLGRPVCVDCGYDLRAAVGRRCPECGRLLPLMRFQCRLRAAGGGPRVWQVTALSEVHARDLLLEHLGGAEAGVSELEVRQSFGTSDDACGVIWSEKVGACPEVSGGATGQGGGVLPDNGGEDTFPETPRESA